MDLISAFVVKLYWQMICRVKKKSLNYFIIIKIGWMQEIVNYQVINA